MSTHSTNRRTLLKFGALAAAPLAVLAPGAVLANDGTKARLARLEDERAITAQLRDVLGRINAGDALGLDPAISAVVPDLAAEPEITFTADGSSAAVRHACTVQRDLAFTGQTTLERMARFQGQTAATASGAATLDLRVLRNADGWAITTLTIA
jgi:hypothetical protein